MGIRKIDLPEALAGIRYSRVPYVIHDSLGPGRVTCHYRGPIRQGQHGAQAV